MPSSRVVVGATGDDAAARTLARRRRDAGDEVVFVGAHQTPEQLAGAALAEDAVEIVVDAGDGSDAVSRIVDALARRGADDVRVTPLDGPTSEPRSPR